ncbi:MAG TPA: radical SAM protein [Candidatus Woesebacteria bacterium]|nr:radical SAM protein [Candidatus Woesebacteria bacterium]
MREALSSTYLEHDHGIICKVCQRECNLAEGATGFCSGYKVENQTLIDPTYGKTTTVQVTELGWAPVSAFAKPSDKILSVGNRGCNFRCDHCINYTHAFARHDEKDNAFISPDTLIEYAHLMSCQGIAANFNEGLLALSYWKDIFKLAKENSLYTVAVTNGYATSQALDEICPYLDVYRSDIKALSNTSMKKQGNYGINPQGILNSLLHVKNNYPQTHIETVTMISPGINNSKEELEQIANWIYTNLGANTPWHISPMDHIQTQKQVTPPDYLKSDQLVNYSTYTGFSISFNDTGAFLQVGDNDLLSYSPSLFLTDTLEQIAQIGKSVGLTNVITKTDGH